VEPAIRVGRIRDRAIVFNDGLVRDGVMVTVGLLFLGWVGRPRGKRWRAGSAGKDGKCPRLSALVTRPRIEGLVEQGLIG
jgi:hypothetical protein